MVSLKFKIILLIFFTLVLLAISVQDVKAFYFNYKNYCGPSTCSCSNALGWVACRATCPSPSCGVRCKCGFAEAKCEVLRCSPPYDRCVNNLHYFNLQCTSISWASGIRCWYMQTEPCTDYWTNSYRCNGPYLQRLYIDRFCGPSACRSISIWKNYQYCGSNYYGSWSYYCYNNDRYQRRTVYNRGCSGSSCYYYTSTQTQFVQDCGTSYYQYRSVCSGSYVLYQQRLISKGCSGSSCYSSYGSWITYSQTYCGTSYYEYRSVCSGSYVLYQQRLISKRCSGSSCYSSYGSWITYSQTNCGTTYYEYRCSGDRYVERRLIGGGCSGGSCYSSSASSWTNYQDCGVDSCGSWNSNYCKDNDVYHSRTCYDRGCANESCYENSSLDEEKVQECGLSTWLDEYQCSGDWTQRKKINRGCSGSSCYETTEWENDQNCSLVCFPRVLNEGCQGGTYTCNDGACGVPLQSCSPPQYTGSGITCECDVEEGTIIRACNGSGSCLDVEEVCDVDCGADLVCQGLKPGDEYPEDPSKICCKGEEGEREEMPLPEWYEVAP